MKTLLFLSFLFFTGSAWADTHCSKLLDHHIPMLNDHKSVHLCESYKHQVLLVVNTASKCGYTPQYEGLEKLHRVLKNEGFTVLGFPSNDFGGQEPGSEASVKQFCKLTYGVEFPMFEKTSVKQGGASAFYAALAKASGSAPSWNFHKYLIDRNGKLIGSFPSNVSPDSPELLSAIITAIAKD